MATAALTQKKYRKTFFKQRDELSGYGGNENETGFSSKPLK